ncbi:MAG: hypothetical protein ACRDV7_05820 [Acidimicrobiia bacterium]
MSTKLGATRPAPPELAKFLVPFDEDVRATVVALRGRVLGVFPNAHEVVWDATNAVSLVTPRPNAGRTASDTSRCTPTT